MSSHLLIQLARGGILVFALLAAAACSGGNGVATTTSGASPGEPATSASEAATTSTAGPSATASSGNEATTTSEPPPTTVATATRATFDTWIAVLASLPVDEYDETAASEIAAATDPAADVLRSDDYESLNPGFWVVYLGEHEFEWEAAAACPDSVPDCYTRYLAGIGPRSPVGADSATALAVTDTGELVVVSTATGELLWALDRPVGGDGAFPGPMTLGSDGMFAFYSVGSEDFWFSCDASDGTLMRLQLGEGEPVQVGDGFSPDISSDGDSLLYLASASCFPDPAEPQWVLAPIDTIVRRDVATGEEDRITIELAGDVAAGYEYWSAAWGPAGEVYVVDTQGGLWRHAPSDDPSRWLEAGERLATLEAGSALVGFDTTLNLLLSSVQRFEDDTPSTFLNGVDVERRAVVALDEFTAPASFALDRTGSHLLTVSAGTMESLAGQTTVGFEAWQLAW